jgi:hypothetical protein
VPLAAISQAREYRSCSSSNCFSNCARETSQERARVARRIRSGSDPSEITIGEIVRLIESPIYTNSCFSKAESVDDCRISSSCVSGAIWKQLAEHVDNFLDSITVADLSNKPSRRSSTV